MLTTPYISLSQQIRTQVPTTKHIDLYNGQYLKPKIGNDHPFNRPAVFIEYSDHEWVEQGKYIQEADIEFTLHCVTDIMTDTMNIDKQTDPARVAALMAPLGFDTLIHAALQRYCPDGCCRGMWRVRTQYDRDHDGLVVVKISYSSRLIENISPMTQVTVTGVNATGAVVDSTT